MVFYRKYRPQKIDELDNESLRNSLYSVFSKSQPPRLSSRSKESSFQSVPHAFLFTGPKGLGKTSTARIIAKVLNCENRKASTVEPCNKCEQCTSITNGNNLDVLEIDGASNRGIDEIRDLREKIKLSPAKAVKKVYIIDEVHMLTTEAFNALLKTLEEPPSHAVFILCTTEPQKVPATITSRCFHLSFKKATDKELIRSFKRIVSQEKLLIDDDAIDAIASLSDGSFRDGVKILDEIALAANGAKISKELVEQKYQITNIKLQMSQYIECFAKKDVKTGLELTAKLIEQGTDMKYFLEQLILRLHAMLLIQVGVKDENDEIFEITFSIDELRGIIGLLTKANRELKYAVLPQIPLEMAVIEWGEEAEIKSEKLKVKSLETEQSESSEVLKRSTGSKESKKSSLGEKIKSPVSHSVASLETHPDIFKPANSSDFWLFLIQKVKSYNHSVAGVLRGCVLKNWGNGKVEIETHFKFHKEKLDDIKAREILQKACSEISGGKVLVSVNYVEKK